MSVVSFSIKQIAKVIQSFRRVYYYLLSDNIHIRGKIIRVQPLLVLGKGVISIQGKANIGYFPSPFFFSGYSHFDLRNQNAKILFGDGVTINNNATLVADGATIDIGENTLIGTHFTCLTSDSHVLHPEKRKSKNYSKQNVIIGRNVFIGNNVTILKGVSIGDNSVIGNSSLVSRDIPDNVIAAGIPCSVIKSLT